MRTIDQFSKRVFIACAGICLILITNALLPSSAKAEKKMTMNGANTIFMGIDNGYAYYLFMPDGDKWVFEKMPLSKASLATW